MPLNKIEIDCDHELVDTVEVQGNVGSVCSRDTVATNPAHEHFLERDVCIDHIQRCPTGDGTNLFVFHTKNGKYDDCRDEYYADAAEFYLEAREKADDPRALGVELGEAYESLLFLDKAIAEYVAAIRGGASAGPAERRLQMLAADEDAGPEVIAALEGLRETGEAPDGALVAHGPPAAQPALFSPRWPIPARLLRAPRL